MKSAITTRNLLPAVTLVALAGCDESAVDPPPPPEPVTVQIGGTVSGLDGTVVLRDNGVDDLSIARDLSFVFPGRLGVGVAYTVTVATQPANQNCVVTNG